MTWALIPLLPRIPAKEAAHVGADGRPRLNRRTIADQVTLYRAGLEIEGAIGCHVRLGCDAVPGPLRGDECLRLPPTFSDTFHSHPRDKCSRHSRRSSADGAKEPASSGTLGRPSLIQEVAEPLDKASCRRVINAGGPKHACHRQQFHLFVVARVGLWHLASIQSINEAIHFIQVPLVMFVSWHHR